MHGWHWIVCLNRIISVKALLGPVNNEAQAFSKYCKISRSPVDNSMTVGTPGTFLSNSIRYFKVLIKIHSKAFYVHFV